MKWKWTLEKKQQTNKGKNSFQIGCWKVVQWVRKNEFKISCFFFFGHKCRRAVLKDLFTFILGSTFGKTGTINAEAPPYEFLFRDYFGNVKTFEKPISCFCLLMNGREHLNALRRLGCRAMRFDFCCYLWDSKGYFLNQLQIVPSLLLFVFRNRWHGYSNICIWNEISYDLQLVNSQFEAQLQNNPN